jgi:hypothetical protein
VGTCHDKAERREGIHWPLLLSTLVMCWDRFGGKGNVAKAMNLLVNK